MNAVIALKVSCSSTSSFSDMVCYVIEDDDGVVPNGMLYGWYVMYVGMYQAGS